MLLVSFPPFDEIALSVRNESSILKESVRGGGAFRALIRFIKYKIEARKFMLEKILFLFQMRNAVI